MKNTSYFDYKSIIACYVCLTNRYKLHKLSEREKTYLAQEFQKYGNFFLIMHSLRLLLSNLLYSTLLLLQFFMICLYYIPPLTPRLSAQSLLLFRLGAIFAYCLVFRFKSRNCITTWVCGSPNCLLCLLLVSTAKICRLVYCD